MVVVTVPVVEAMEAREMVVEVRAREAAEMALERGGAARAAEPEVDAVGESDRDGALVVDIGRRRREQPEREDRRVHGPHE